MLETIKKAVLISLLLLLGFGLGVLYYSHSSQDKSKGETILPPPEIIQPEKNKIDSLEVEIISRDSIISYLREKIHRIESTRTDKVDSIRELPTTEAVEFLRLKLKEFDSKY